MAGPHARDLRTGFDAAIAMNIAFLTHEPFFPPSGGGSAEAVYFVQHLARRGHVIHLFCPDFPNREQIARDFNIRIHPFTLWPMGRYSSLRTPKYLLFPWFLARSVVRQARQVSFHAIVAQHAVASVAAGQLKARLGLPVILNFLDYLTGFMETWPRYLAPRRFIRALERFEISIPQRYGVDGVMTVSDPLADAFAATGLPRVRLRPIYYGYDADKFKPVQEGEADEAPPVVVMHGSFDRHHLGQVAVEAVRTVHAARPDVRFRLVGRETPTLRAFCRKVRSVSPGVPLELPGFVPYAETAAQLNRAAVGIVPYEESTGTHYAFVAKLVEYLGVGLPVVSTSLRSVSRYFGGDPAATFTGFDGQQFGDAILRWLKRSAQERRSLGLQASARVARELDWSSVCGRAADFVEQVAGAKA